MYRHIIVVTDIPQLSSMRQVCLSSLMPIPHSNGHPNSDHSAILASEQERHLLLPLVLLVYLSAPMPLPGLDRHKDKIYIVRLNLVGFFIVATY